MSRNSSRGRRKSGRMLGFVGLFLGIPSVFVAACHADRFFDDLAPPRSETTGKPSPRESASPRSTPTTAPANPSQTAFADPSIHLALGIPTDDTPEDDHLLRKPQYALSYNSVRNGPNWVSWELNAGWFGAVPRHKGKFLEDRELPRDFYRTGHDDYTGSGYDRGHMVRSEERTRTPEDNKSTFLMTNILPQYHDLNAGPWLRLEEFCEKLSKRENKELFVMAGGVFPKSKRSTKVIGKVIGKDVAVPDKFFKIVIILESGQGAADVQASTPVIAVIMPNETGIQDNGWEGYRVTIDEIEKRTGYEFLSAVPEAIQRVIEARKGD